MSEAEFKSWGRAGRNAERDTAIEQLRAAVDANFEKVFKRYNIVLL